MKTACCVLFCYDLVQALRPSGVELTGARDRAADDVSHGERLLVISLVRLAALARVLRLMVYMPHGEASLTMEDQAEATFVGEEIATVGVDWQSGADLAQAWEDMMQ